MKVKVLAISLLLSGALSAFSQSSVPVLKDNTVAGPEDVYKTGDLRGTIKRKAVLLPNPPYPREAMEAGAEGAVRVEIEIDADGNVITAKAVSGHPMLYQAAEETARKAKFRKAETAAPSGTETGTIVYNFAFEKAGWVRIGYDLTVIQKAPTLRPFLVPRVAKAFQPDWTGEHEILGKIGEMRRLEIETLPVAPSNKPVIVKKNAPAAGGSMQSEMRAEIALPTTNPPTAERIALAQNLTSLLQSRLAGDEANLWRLNLGVNLAKTFEIGRDPRQLTSAAVFLRQSLDAAPAQTPAEMLDALRTLIGLYESGRRPFDAAGESSKAMTVLFKGK